MPTISFSNGVPSILLATPNMPTAIQNTAMLQRVVANTVQSTVQDAVDTGTVTPGATTDLTAGAIIDQPVAMPWWAYALGLVAIGGIGYGAYRGYKWMQAR